MLNLIKMTVPIVAAEKEARAADEFNADSPLFHAKVAIASAFGEAALRPWRLCDAENDIYTIMGWVSDLKAVAPTPASRRLGVYIDAVEWLIPSAGDTCTFDILATPVKSVRTGVKKEHRRHIDVAMMRTPDTDAFSKPTGSERANAWISWLQSEMSSPRTGMRVEKAPKLVGHGSVGAKRNIAFQKRQVTLPVMRAHFDAAIVDVGTLNGFLRLGFKKAKDLGLGCLLPVSALAQEGLL